MSRTHEIERGETLFRVAHKYYNDAGLYDELALYNGIRDPNRIRAGQWLMIPTRHELTVAAAAPLPDDDRPPTPHGLEGVIDTFGDIYDWMQDDGTLDSGFQRQQLDRADLPFPVALSWDTSRRVTQLYCHKLLAPVFVEVFETIERAGLRDEVRTYGGCFNFRSKRSAAKLSTHSWAISVDLNPESNPMGSDGDMHPGIVEIFQTYGFKWGGDWPGRARDPMHFQYCTGY